MKMTLNELLTVVTYFVGFVSLIGIWLALGTNISKMKERFRISKNLRVTAYNRKWLKNKWLRRYHFLLSSALKRYEIEHFSKILTIQFTAFMSLTAILFLVTGDYQFSIIMPFIFVYLLPLGFLYFIHKQKQNALQDDLIESSVILLQEYEKNHHSMLFALKEVVDQTKGASRIAYARLFARMHDDNYVKEIAAETFTFQLGHFRGKNLASIILRGCKDGVQVGTLLEDLVEDITEFNKRVRDAETESRETAMIGYAPLPALVILHFINDRWLIPGGNASYYQFQTAQGLKSFMVAATFGIVGIGLALLIKKPKK